MITLLELPTRIQSYTADEVISFVAKKMKTDTSSARQMIAVGDALCPSHFFRYSIIIAKSFGEIVGLEQLADNRKIQREKYQFKPGLPVAILIQEVYVPKINSKKTSKK